MNMAAWFVHILADLCECYLNFMTTCIMRCSTDLEYFAKNKSFLCVYRSWYFFTILDIASVNEHHASVTKSRCERFFLLADESTSYDQSLNLIRALEDLCHLNITHHSLYW